MLAIIGRWYSRRIVNVNVNIIAAGLLALIPVLGCVRLVEYFLATPAAANREILQTHHKLIITGVTFVSDIVLDVFIYYFLHWLANHAPWLKKQRLEQIEAVADAAVDSSPFFKDATKVQLQRAVISPGLYLIWLGTQFVMMQVYGWSAVWATVLGFVVSVGLARTVHTVWMLREEANRKKAIAAGKPVAPIAVPSPGQTKHAIWENVIARPTTDNARGLNVEPKPDAELKSSSGAGQR